MDNKDTLKAEITSIVADIFEGKKEEEQRSRTEEALETAATSINDLTTKVGKLEDTVASVESEKSTLKEELDSVKETFKTDKTEIETKLAESEKSAEELKSQFETVSAELEDLKQEAVASTRIGELEVSGVLRNDAETQKAKVKTMSDEEFASYKDELEAIRKSILEQLEAANKSEETSDEDASKEDASKEKDDGIVTPPVEISSGNALSAALNMEIVPSDDIVKKYQDLGNAMAASMIKESK